MPLRHASAPRRDTTRRRARPPGRRGYLTDGLPRPGCRACRAGRCRHCASSPTFSPTTAMGGQVKRRVGLDGPWDIKRIIGTVPVAPDGSALSRVPANTPISGNPSTGTAKALQLGCGAADRNGWRSGLLRRFAMSRRTASSPPRATRAATARRPATDRSLVRPHPWFQLDREVQPVLDAHLLRVMTHACRRHAPGAVCMRLAPE